MIINYYIPSPFSSFSLINNLGKVFDIIKVIILPILISIPYLFTNPTINFLKKKIFF